VTRQELGLPQDWSRIESWLNNMESPDVRIPEVGTTVKRKNPEVPILEDYTKPPSKDFWKNFPSKKLPETAESNVDAAGLRDLVEKAKDNLTHVKYIRGVKCAELIRKGATCCQKYSLPACMQNNAKSATKYGVAVTDTIVSWIKDGFVAGPFDQPPLEKFRVNCLMAIPQPGKIRPVLNGSLPLNNSLNSNVDPIRVEKVEMCSARCYSYSVVEAGDSGYMAKMDMVNAYKNVPCDPEEYRLQGFHWLGKFFVETRQIFGAKTAVCNFDILGNTLLELALLDCEINPAFVHRQLDDVPIVCPKSKITWCKEFVKNYKECCNSVGVDLAVDDPNKEKAFFCTREGKVLGIEFKTTGLLWAYPDDKKEKALAELSRFLSEEPVDLNQMQKLMGRLNDIGLMAPFMKTFKGPMNELLGWLQSHPNSKVKPGSQAVKDAKIWAGFILDKNRWNPIAHRPNFPPMAKYEFVSDAAGLTEANKENGKVGVGVIGFDTASEIILAHQTFWPDSLRDSRDRNGIRFGDKTVFLESIGLLIPFLLVPEIIKCAHVVLGVDNIGCYYGWENQNVSGDKCASIVIRSILLISSYLSVKVHVVHLPRVSNWEAIFCDRISRESTTSEHDKRLLKTYENLKIPKELKNWLKNPIEDYNICMKLLNHVKMKIKM